MCRGRKRKSVHLWYKLRQNATWRDTPAVFGFLAYLRRDRAAYLASYSIVIASRPIRRRNFVQMLGIVRSDGAPIEPRIRHR